VGLTAPLAMGGQEGHTIPKGAMHDGAPCRVKEFR